MKKFLLSLAALALNAGAFAQSASFIGDVTFNVPGQTQFEDLENVFTVASNGVVSITFNGYNSQYVEDNNITPMLIRINGTGFAMSDPVYEMLEPTEDHFTMNLSGNWGNPAFGNYFANLQICFLDEEMDFVLGTDDEPLFWEVSYTTPDVVPASLVSVYPNNDWSEESFASAYDQGIIRFTYSNAVDFDTEDIIGMIDYVFVNGEVADPVFIEIGENAEAGWNRWDGAFSLSVEYALEGVTANQISEITVTIFDAESLGETVDEVEVTLENNNPNIQRIAKKMKKSPLANSISVNNETVSVYNVAGMLVKDNISESEISTLPKGLYIVNGKKVVVK